MLTKTLTYIVFTLLFAILTIAGCTSEGGTTQEAHPTDTIYTQEAAMMVYDYDPVRALQIIDSAVIVGNLSDWQADKNRMRIYSQTGVGARLDSLLGGSGGVRFDSARAIGERLLQHDSIKNSLEGQQDVLEMLAYTARLQNDTTAWLQWSRQLVDVCRRQGAATEALRTEAELAASLYYAGQKELSLARLDSVTAALSCMVPFRFNELDALIIASKREIGVLNSMGRYAETLPVARRIIERLDDYEAHSDQYHDGTYREPTDSTERGDYIRFYRTQAQGFITAAYAALGQTGDMKATFEQLENIVREAETREHQTRYRALEQQMAAQRQQMATEARAERSRLVTIIFAILLVAALAALAWYWRQKRIVSRKNRILVRQIDEALKYKELYQESEKRRVKSEKSATAQGAAPASAEGMNNPGTLINEQLFQHISEVIERERLFLDPKFGRQTIIDRFQLSKDSVGAAFAQGSSYDSLTDYVQELRLEHAARLLKEQPRASITQVATQSGFASAQYFSRRFRQRFGMSPSDYREAHQTDV